MRKSESGVQIKIFELNAITYSTVCALHLAIRTLPQLAIDELKNFSMAESVLREDFYMFDMLTGAGILISAKQLQSELTEILRSAGMSLHKWWSYLSKLYVDSKDFQIADFVIKLWTIYRQRELLQIYHLIMW